jgi:hypothetical protein
MHAHAPEIWQALSGSLQSVSAVPVPAQHCLRLLTSAPAPRHVHTLPVHIPDEHSAGSLHDFPLPTNSWQNPPKHSPDTHASSPLQPRPSASLAVQLDPLHHPDVQSASRPHAEPFACAPQIVAFEHTPDLQSPSLVQANPSSALPQCASTQIADWHSAGRVQALPSTCATSHSFM